MILLTSSYSSTFVFETNLNTNVLYKHMWKRSFPQESLQSCGKLSVPNDSAACRTTMSSSNLKKLFPVYQNFTGPVQRVKAFCVTWLPDLKKVNPVWKCLHSNGQQEVNSWSEISCQWENDPNDLGTFSGFILYCNCWNQFWICSFMANKLN